MVLENAENKGKTYTVDKRFLAKLKSFFFAISGFTVIL